MRRKLTVAIFSIVFLILIFFILLRITDVDFIRRSDEENAARILRWNLRGCGEISRVSREYGEGTLTVKCANGEAYLLSSSEHCDHPFRVYCWDVDDLNPTTLKRQ